MNKPETSIGRPMTLVETLDVVWADMGYYRRKDYKKLRDILQALDEQEERMNRPYTEYEFEVWNKETDTDDYSDLREPMQ